MAMREWQLLFLVWDTLNDHARRGLMRAWNHNLKQLFVSNRVEKLRIFIAGPGDTTLRQMSPSPPPLCTHKVLMSMSPREEKSCFLMKQMKKFVSRITSTVSVGLQICRWCLWIFFRFAARQIFITNHLCFGELERKCWARCKFMKFVIYCKWKYLKRSMWSFVKE